MLSQTGEVALFLSCAASMFSELERLQNARAREREQLKWFAYGAAVFVGAVLSIVPR
jgi:hypothetical protein